MKKIISYFVSAVMLFTFMTPVTVLAEEETPTLNLHTTATSSTNVQLTWDDVDDENQYTIYVKKGSGEYQEYGTTQEGNYDITVEKSQSYTFKVVETKGEESIEEIITFNNKSIVSHSHKKYTYSEMKGDIQSLTKKYYGYVTYKVIGKSEDGRNIYDVILGNPDASKKLLVISAIHAREYITSIVTMSQIEYYLQNYNNTISGEKVSKTLDKVCIHFVTMANPDGVTISQSGFSKINSSSLRSKLKKMKKGSTTRWKSNARGVDLNRNWPIAFRKRGKAGNDGYSGKKAASESEVKALLSLKKSLKSDGLKGIINYHTTGSIIYGYTYSSNTSTVKSVTKKMYNLAKKKTGYKKAPTSSLYSSAGNAREYDLCSLKIPSITIELGKKSAPNPISEYSTMWKKNKTLVLEEAQLLE